MSIKSNIEYVNELKGIAAEKSGRKPEDVLLVAVTKLHTPAEINEAIDAGVTDIGENKVQEIMDKYDAVKPVRWHLIGHLQTNKVKYIIDKVCMFSFSIFPPVFNLADTAVTIGCALLIIYVLFGDRFGKRKKSRRKGR